MKVYILYYNFYDAAEVIGCYASEEIAEKYLKLDIQQKFGMKWQSRHVCYYDIIPFDLIGE
jgi:hypothetical protein